MATIIAILVGLLIGASTGREFGYLAGPLLGWLAVRALRQQAELETLKKGIELLRSGVAGDRPAADTARAATAATPAATMSPSSVRGPMAPVAAAHAPAQAPAAASADQAIVEAALARQASAAPATAAAASNVPSPAAAAMPALAATPARPPAPPPAPPRPNPLAPILGWFFGGNTIVKAGVAILFVGLAFLAKYAAEHTQVPIEWRLGSIGAVAVVLLGIGWRLRGRRPAYAQVLQGGAVAVLYLTLFAAFRFYGVLGVAPAFATMAAVAALSAALAVLQDARALAVVGALGGFAAPLLLSTGGGNHVALFGYYLVLDLGIAAIAWSKTWRSLNLIGFFATFVVATAWGVLRYEPENFASAEAFLAAFFLVFVAVMVLPARRVGKGAAAPLRSDAWVNSTLLFGLPTVVFALQYGLVRDTEYGAALSALGLGAFYVALATWMRRRPALGITFDASLAIATLFITLVIPFALDERSTAGAWTLEAAGLVWVGFRQRRMLPRAFGYGLFVLSALSMLYAHDRHGMPTAFWNAYFFNGVMAAAAALAAALFVSRAGDARRRGEEAGEPALIVLGTLWLAATATIQIDRFVAPEWSTSASLATLAVLGAGYALLLRALAWRGIGWPLVAFMPVAFVAALGQAAVLADPLAFGGWWAWPMVFAAHALVLRIVAPQWPREAAHAVHAVGALTLALVGALAGRALTAPWGDPEGAWPWLGWLLVPALLLLVLPRPATTRVWPVRALPEAYRTTAAALLGTALWMWTLVANVGSNGSAAPLPHLPFLNPLDIGIGIALAAIALAARGAAPPVANAARPALAIAGFVWLNAVLVRGFHHYAGVPYRFAAWADSFAVQTGLALLWAATALVTMWWAARRGQRVPWVVGAALLAAVVLKLVFVDLMAAGTVTRIVSFIGVGVAMLVIGYVAPLPGAAGATRRKEPHAST